MNSNDAEFNSVAALIGSTNAGLKQVQENIIDGDNNLISKWDPKAVLKNHVLQNQGEVPSAPPPPSAPMSAPPAGVHPNVQPPPPQHIPMPVQVQPAQQAFITDPQILERLDKIEAALSKLSITEDKIMNNLLKNKTKQITIRFDDTTPKKQK